MILLIIHNPFENLASLPESGYLNWMNFLHRPEGLLLDDFQNRGSSFEEVDNTLGTRLLSCLTRELWRATPALRAELPSPRRVGQSMAHDT